MAENAWQIGSKKPPTVCLCCGQKFDQGERKRRGPYLESPYIWVCKWCWDKPYLFFPDKQDHYTKAHFQPQPIHDSLDRYVDGKRIIRLSIMDGITISAELKDIPLGDLTLDPNNVRFKHLQMQDSQEEITKVILSDMTAKTLYNQILSASGLTNSPVVDSDLVVREGNRRIVCLRKIRDEIIDGKWDINLDRIDPVQCIVLPRHLLESQIAIYLTREHVVGKKPWRTVNKAAFVHELRSEHGLTYKQIHDAVGIGPRTLSVMEQAYSATIMYKETYPDDKDWLGRYSYFFEFYRLSEFKQWGRTPKNLKKIMRLIYTGRIAVGSDMRRFAKQVASKKESLEQKRKTTDEIKHQISALQREYRSLINLQDKQINEILDHALTRHKVQLETLTSKIKSQEERKKK